MTLIFPNFVPGSAPAILQSEAIFHMKRTIVISAVNIRKGGTLTILRQCLSYLSSIADKYRIVALVHSKGLCEYEGIEYIEMPWCAKSWGRRLWAEYASMKKISKRLAPVYLWFSLHDTSPRVKAERRAVYCQTAFPFLKTYFQDFRFDPKIVAFSIFTRFAYKINVRSNDWLVSQTSWFRDGLSKILGFEAERIIVCRPEAASATGDKAATDSSETLSTGNAGNEDAGNIDCNYGDDSYGENDDEAACTEGTGNEVVESCDGAETTPYFIYPATPDCHKCFESICEAAKILENKLGKGRFKLILTIRGDENSYASWIKEKWGCVSSVEFRGFVKREELERLFCGAAALCFPSRMETWGLPISEFKPTGKPMILSDLPYSHETAAGAPLVRFVRPRSASAFAEAMAEVLKAKTGHRWHSKSIESAKAADRAGETNDAAEATFRAHEGGFAPVPAANPAQPVAESWSELFNLLLR